MDGMPAFNMVELYTVIRRTSAGPTRCRGDVINQI